jgi:hypothetical protein
LDALRKHLYVLDHNLQVLSFPGRLAGGLLLAFQFLQTVFQPRNTCLKIRFLQVPLLVGVDQARHATPHFTNHLRQLFQWATALLVLAT